MNGPIFLIRNILVFIVVKSIACCHCRVVVVVAVTDNNHQTFKAFVHVDLR